MKKKTKRPASRAPVVQHNTRESFDAGIVTELPTVQNGLSEAIFGASGFNMGFPFGAGLGTQLNDLNTIFNNNRWVLISNMRQILSQVYAEHGLIQTIIDVPVDDAFRGGPKIKTGQISEDQLKLLQAKMKRLGDWKKAAQAQKWKRLFGGGAILPILGQDPYEPLDIPAISVGDPVEFRAVDMWELFWDKQNTEGFSAELQDENVEHYSYYGKQLHKSRAFVVKGREAPSFIRPRLRGWGLSEIEALVDSLNQWLKSNNLVFEVLDEFKLDVFKFKGLNNTLIGKDGTSKVRNRAELANKNKNFLNSIVMDSEDEFDHKQLSFAGIAEMYKEFRMQVSCALKMPISKIWGVSSTGFSSGEDDIENYNAMIESTIREPCEPDLIKMVEIRCQQLFGMVPTDLELEWNALRVLSTEQEENVKTQKFNRIQAALSLGAMQVKEYKDACNKDNLLVVQLDTSIEELTPAGGGEDDGSGPEPGEKKDDKPKKDFEGKAPASKLKAKEAKS